MVNERAKPSAKCEVTARASHAHNILKFFTPAAFVALYTRSQ
jgi:hypothetical protein